MVLCVNLKCTSHSARGLFVGARAYFCAASLTDSVVNRLAFSVLKRMEQQNGTTGQLLQLRNTVVEPRLVRPKWGSEQN
jgi:hypothetical protein